MKEGYIKWLSELSKGDISIAGGKGANLGELYNAGFPIPQAFIVTSNGFHYFIEKAGIKNHIYSILSQIDIDDTGELEKKSREIRELITSATLPEDLEREILEAYDTFNIDLESMKSSPNALAIMKTARESVFVAVRSSIISEDLDSASFAGQQESFINIKGNRDVIDKIKEVFSSAFTARSIYYKIKRGFDVFAGISVVVQKMINSDKSGVIFSVNPVTQKDILIEAVFGQGVGIVSGQIKPDIYTLSEELEIISERVSDKKVAIVRDSSGLTKTVQLSEEKSNQRVLQTYEIKQLGEYAMKMQAHYDKPQNIEFAIEDGKIYILQTRPITTLIKKEDVQELQGQIIVQGVAASPGIGSGVVRIIRSIDDLNKIRKGDIIVTEMTNPNMAVSIQKASAIVTDEGGITAHAATISREENIPAVVGTNNATSKLEDGMEVTVDGFSGRIFLGRVENKKVEILPVVETKTKIKVLIDLPEFAERAAKTNAYGVGLVKLEGMVASSGKHPMEFKETDTLNEYQKIIREGLERIAEQFIGKEIWVRTTDIRSDEYSNLEGSPTSSEKNPMLGMHGIRYSLKNPEIFKAELNVIKELALKGHRFGVMFPQVTSLEELKKAKEIIRELEMPKVVRIGTIIETPAAAVLIKDICEEGIDFISIGTDNLTQYTLVVDRGNEEVQDLYNENSWAIKKQISRVIRECRQHNIETSIYGQVENREEMIEFLVRQGIDSISVNADNAREVSELVKNIESSRAG